MLSFLYVYSDHSILECYNLFSGVELSMRSFFVIISYWDDFSKCRNFYKWTKYKTTKSVKDVADKEFNSLAY